MRHAPSGVQGLVFGGLMAGLVVVFALIPALSVFMPVPLVLTFVRYGGRAATLASVVATLFSIFLIGPVQAVAVLIPAGIAPGLVLGYGFHRRLRPITIGVLTVAVFFGTFAVNYTLTKVVLLEGRDPFAVALESEEIQSAVEKQLDTLEAVVRQSAAGQADPNPVLEWQLALIAEMRHNPLGVTWTLLPATLFLIGALTVSMQYVLCRLVLVRLGHEVPQGTPFSKLRLPLWLAVAYIAATLGSGYLSLPLSGSPWWVQFALNARMVLTLVFVIGGIATAYGLLRTRGVSRWPAAVYSLLGLLLGSVGIQFYVLLAVLDLIFDFRGLGHGWLKRPGESP